MTEGNIPHGLTRQEVDEAKKKGLVNKTDKSHGKSYGKIIVDNLFTVFNLLYLIITIILVSFGTDLSNLGYAAVVLPNILLAIISEVRAKMTVERLSVTTDPRATVVREGALVDIPADEIVVGDVMRLLISRQILSDAVVISGECEVNESMLTGESVPVKKKAGDRLFAGSFLVSGSVYAEVDRVGKDNYVNTLETAAKAHKAPTSNLFRSLDTLIKSIGILMVPMTIATFLCNWYVESPTMTFSFDVMKAVAERTCGSVIGMIPAGMYLLVTLTLSLSVILLGRKKTLVQDMYSIEMLARADVLCLDKTGTITDGTMRVASVVPLGDIDVSEISLIMSYLECGDNKVNATSRALVEHFGERECVALGSVPFSSERKYSSLDIEGVGAYALGAPHFVPAEISPALEEKIKAHADLGERVLLLSHLESLEGAGEAVAIITLEDRIRPGAQDTIRRFQEQDVAVKVISGDHAATVSAIAKKVGIANAEKYVSCESLTDEELIAAAEKYAVFGRVTPEQKVLLVRTMKEAGHTVAMTGDGVNDTLALKEANCAIAMADGSEVARAIAEIVLLDSDFSHLPEVVREGRRCINNVRSSASLFVMKTIFTILISLFAVFTVTGYPFTPKNFMLLELFIIGCASYALALEPNNERIKGDFLEHVLTSSLPYAVAMFIPTLAMLIFAGYSGYPISTAARDSIAMCAVLVAGYMNLLGICRPYTKWRVGVVAIIGTLLAGGTLVGIFFSDVINLGFIPAGEDPKILVIALVLAAASAVLMHLLKEPLQNLVRRIIEKVSRKKAK